MRNLLAVGIVSVVVLTAWILFLNDDLKRFKKEYTIANLPQQDSNAGSDKAGVQNENLQEPLENADTSIQSTESPESVSTVNNTNTDKGNTASAVGPQQTLTDTALSLSPETIKLYQDYRIIDDELIIYNIQQYIPMKNYYFTLTERSKEILYELANGNHDIPTMIAMHQENDEIQAWYDENSTRMYGLQDTVNQLKEKRLTLLTENGYSSHDEFLTVHRNTYQTWRSEQTNK